MQADNDKNKTSARDEKFAANVGVCMNKMVQCVNDRADAYVWKNRNPLGYYCGKQHRACIEIAIYNRDPEAYTASVLRDRRLA